MGRKMPQVTIGLPVYNGEAFIARAIESILSQTYQDLELIIMDNCSTDGTKDICEQYLGQDPRVRYFRHDENVGVIANFNSAFEHARGKYFKWAASDDICAPTLVEKLVQALEDRPQAVIAFSGALIFDEYPEVGLPNLTEDEYPRYNVTGITYCQRLFSRTPMERIKSILRSDHPGTMIYGLIRSDALRKSHLHQVEGSDRLLLTELALEGEYILVDEPLFYRRIHEDNVDRSRREYIAMVHGTDHAGILMPPWRWPLNYIKTIAFSDQSNHVKIRVIATVIRHTFRMRFLRNLLVPGPENYWGISKRKLRMVYIF